MQFRLFRISIVAKSQPGLFEKHPPATTDQEKDAMIRAALRHRPKTEYRNKIYAFSNIFERQYSKKTCVLGRISRPQDLEVSVRDPETGDLVDGAFKANAWTWFVYTGAGTQIIAVAQKQDFFSGKRAGLASIVEALLEKGIDSDQYLIVAKPIPKPRAFWDVIGQASKVTSVRFEMLPPNWGGGASKLKEALRRDHEATNMSRKIITYTNPEDGLQVPESDEELDDEVDYIERGGGSWSINYKDAEGKPRKHSSRETGLDVPVEGEETDEQVMLDRFDSIMDDIFGAMPKDKRKGPQHAD